MIKPVIQHENKKKFNHEECCKYTDDLYLVDHVENQNRTQKSTVAT